MSVAGSSQDINQVMPGYESETPDGAKNQTFSHHTEGTENEHQEINCEHCECKDLVCPVPDCVWTGEYCKLVFHYTQTHKELLIGPEKTVPSLTFKLKDRKVLHLLYVDAVDGEKFFMVTLSSDEKGIGHSVQGFPYDIELSQYKYNFSITQSLSNYGCEEPQKTFIWNALKVLAFDDGTDALNQIPVDFFIMKLELGEEIVVKFAVTCTDSKLPENSEKCADCEETLDNPVVILARCGCNVCLICSEMHGLSCVTNMTAAINDPQYKKQLDVFAAILAPINKKKGAARSRRSPR